MECSPIKNDLQFWISDYSRAGGRLHLSPLSGERFRPGERRYIREPRIFAERVHLWVCIENWQRRRSFFARAVEFPKRLVPLPERVPEQRHVIGIHVFGF